MNFDRLVEALKRAVRHLLEYARGLEDARRELERVAEAHRLFRLEVGHLRSFVEALVALAVERDPHPMNDAQREELRCDWRLATEPGVSRFAELAQVTMPRVSAVVARSAALDTATATPSQTRTLVG